MSERSLRTVVSSVQISNCSARIRAKYEGEVHLGCARSPHQRLERQTKRFAHLGARPSASTALSESAAEGATTSPSRSTWVRSTRAASLHWAPDRASPRRKEDGRKGRDGRDAHGVAQGQGQAGPSTSKCFTPTASPQEEEGNEQQEGEQGEGEAEYDRAHPTA